ncbi:MAG: hypothetical protein VX641_04145 [Planctomycetota bacterium]|nr:hypothetical protein [Planctomycetota bacterium]
MIAFIGAFLATRSFVLKSIARPHLEATFGGDIEIGSIRWLDFDALKITDLVVKVPGWNDVAGEVVRIDAARIELDTGALKTGAFEILEMDIDGMTFRIAERANAPGMFNVLELEPADGGGGDGSPPKRIDVRNFRMEMGITNQEGWIKTGEVLLSGDLVSDPENRQEFFFTLVSEEDQSVTPTVLKGRFDTSTLAFAASMDDLVITSKLLGMMPVELRKATDSMELQGVVDRLDVSWNRADALSATIDLGSASMVIPNIDTEETWSRLDAGIVTPAGQSPIVEISSGRLRLERERLIIDDFTGRMRGQEANTDPIPIVMAFEMDLQDRYQQNIDWSDTEDVTRHVFELAPFLLEINVPNFRIRSDGAGVILPRAAAQAFSEFGVEEWRVNIGVRISRDEPEVREDGSTTSRPLRTQGQVMVDSGIGRYSRFPYPLENVRANIEFTDEVVTISNLIGTGPDGGSVVVEGTIIDPGSAAAIDVTVRGNDVPADRVFRSALDGWRRRTWDRFFDRHAERRLREAGLLTTKEQVDEAVRERTLILQELNELGTEPETAASRNSLQDRAERLDRIIQSGPFELGGIFSFNLKVTSEAGENQPVYLTGDIDILEGDVVVSDFPFPIHLEESRITLTPDDILINGGLFFTTPDGGTGVIRGSIHNPDTPEGKDPISVIDVSFAAIQVELSETLLAALPPAGEDQPIDPNTWPGAWRSEPARALAALGLQGQLDVEGTLRGDRARPDDDPVLNFQTTLMDGSITPDAQLADFFAEAGFIWPEGFQLENCRATLSVAPERSTLRDFRGERLDGVVEASGFMSRSSDESGLDVQFSDIQMEEYLIDFLPQGNQSQAVDFWNRFNPRGRFDAQLEWAQTESGRRDSTVEVEPESVTMSLNGEDVTVARREGDIYIHPDDIQLDGLILDISGSGYEHGTLELDGAYGIPRDGRLLVLDGSVVDGRFESPILEVLYELIGVPRVLATWRELAPDGSFESHFEYRGVPIEEGGEDAYAIDVAPRNMGVTLDGERITADFETGALYISPGRFDLEHLVARVPAPGIIDINGNVTVNDTIDVELEIDYDLDGLPRGFQGYFPPPLSTGFRSVDFSSAGPLSIQGARISGSWQETALIEEPDLYEFTGDIEVEGAAFEAGPDFDEFDATISLECSARWDAASGRLIKHLDGLISGDRLDVQGRQVSNLRAAMRLREDDVFRLESMFGVLAEGAVAGELELDLQSERWALDVQLEDGALDILSRDGEDPQSEGTTGRVLGGVRVTGLLDDPGARNGRGLILIEDGAMTNSPLTFSILQLSQLMLPVSSSLDYAEIAFTIDGDKMVFDDFLLSSPSVTLSGGGEMSLEDWRLALRLFPKGTIPIFSDIVGTITGTLYAINVKGTLDEPITSIEALPILGDRAKIDPERVDLTPSEIDAEPVPNTPDD